MDLSIRRFRSEKIVTPGVGINYTKAFMSRHSLTAMLNGAFIDSAAGGSHNPSKKLLLEGNIGVQRRLNPTQSTINTFFLAGVGGSQLDKRFGLFVPIGGVVQVDLKREAFLSFNAQYRMPIFSSFQSQIFVAVGIGGALTRRKQPAVIKLQKTIPPRISSFAQEEQDTDHDGIIDWEDHCPDEPGTVANHGCGSTGMSAMSISDVLDSLAAKINFESNSATLKDESTQPLNEIAHVLKIYSNIKLDVSGHTDSVGSVANNLQLSYARANTVVTYLADHGILRARLSYIGFGESRPLFDDGTIEGRRKNRRVECKVAVH